MSYQVRLDMFEGPFELLLYLIEKDQIDIFDIPVAKITKQYIEHLEIMSNLNLEVTSSFLLMASTLLAIKAKTLLPAITQDEEEVADIEWTKQQLIDNILYYKAFKEVSQLFEELRHCQAQYLPRPEARELYMQFFVKQNPLDGKDANDLWKAYQRVMQRLEKTDIIIEIPHRQITVESKINTIIKLAKSHKKGFLFSTLFTACKSKNEMVITFLALLELLRKGVLLAVQNNFFDDIYLYESNNIKEDISS
ncbi:MAG: segregation and condensation protein A [Bacillota bacterium]|jgi:segregation and condensation protein A